MSDGLFTGIVIGLSLGLALGAVLGAELVTLWMQPRLLECRRALVALDRARVRR